MRSRDSQSGLTIIGFVFVAAVLLAMAMIGFRMAPAYIEYFSVEKILRQTLENSRDGFTEAEFRRSFDIASGADYIEAVRGSDIDVRKQGNDILVSADWTTTLHMIGNVSLLLDFHASAGK